MMHNEDVAHSEPAPRALTSKRVDGIDLLRGLSIFFVLMNHVNIRLLGADVPYTELLPAQLLHALVWNFTLLGVGTCMFIAATTQTEWRSPRVFALLVRIGRYSYEIYLTHMFVVFTFFGL